MLVYCELDKLGDRVNNGRRKFILCVSENMWKAEWSLVDMVDLLPVPEMIRILVGKLRDSRPVLSLCLEILSRLTSAILDGLFPVRNGPKQAIPAGIVGLWERIALIFRACTHFIPSPDDSNSGKNHDYTLDEQLDTGFFF